MLNDVLVLSANFGGPAEAVLRAIAHDNQPGIGNIPDAKLMLRAASSWVTEDYGPFTMESRFTGLEPEVNGEQKVWTVFPVRLMLGVETGILLQSVSKRELSRGRIFSTKHRVGRETKNVDYVIPISELIWEHRFPDDAELTQAQVRRNIAQAVYGICDFILKHRQEGLLNLRESLIAAEPERLKRKAEHRAEREENRRFKESANSGLEVMSGDRVSLWCDRLGWVG
ncbi:TPA: hypothetical protein DCQ44_00480 [Candidatus Taylorbacteria bacterium]|nr:hypothetical protein [Candidatus Taylorbacteria bacterium]